MNNTQEQYQNDEINLIELLTTLWKNKFLILTMGVIFGMAGIVYALLAPQLWTAKAIVSEPLPAQLGDLQLRLENFIALDGIVNSEDSRGDIRTAKQLEVDSDFSSDKMFLDFSSEKLFVDYLQAFNSFENKIEFLKKNGYPRQKELKDGVVMQQALAKMAKNIVVKQRKNEEFVTLSFGIDNAQEALTKLNEYINFIQTKEVATKNKLIEDKVANRINSLTLIYKVQKEDTFKRLQDDIALTEFALRISRSAGIETPVENLNNQGRFPIDLGAKALHEKLNILKEIKIPELIYPKIANTRSQLEGLKALPQEKFSFSSYLTLQAPSEPSRRDKPVRTLVVIASTFVGLITGVIVALLRVVRFSGTYKKIQQISESH